MKYYSLSIRRLIGYILAAVLITDAVILWAAYMLTYEWRIILAGGLVAAGSIFWGIFMTCAFQKKLSMFTSEICLTIEEMISDKIQEKPYTEEETLLARIIYRLNQLQHMMQRQKETLDNERKELQQLVSDISHQTKTPVTNLKMIQETLLNSELSEILTTEEQKTFLQAQGTQIEKLDFLVQAMVKSSRLETGVIELEKKEANLYETLAETVGQVFMKASQKEMFVQLDCPEEFWLCFDKKWTSEAIYNLLDNAVKYTPFRGTIRISVERWEAYTKIDIADNGKGIPESHYALVFQRFYREADVHDEEGIGIGLYLAREIVTLQGGYMKVKSKEGEGTVFSVFLPNEIEKS